MRGQSATLKLSWRDHACRRNLAATFRNHIINSRDADNITSLTPVRVLGSCSFMYMRHGDVYILGVTKTNANVMMAFQFMTNVSFGTPNCFLNPACEHVKTGCGLRHTSRPCSTECSTSMLLAERKLAPPRMLIIRSGAFA